MRNLNRFHPVPLQTDELRKARFHRHVLGQLRDVVASQERVDGALTRMNRKLAELNGEPVRITEDAEKRNC